eukprot:12216789-Ditylum_brightwellii.AAC.1
MSAMSLLSMPCRSGYMSIVGSLNFTSSWFRIASLISPELRQVRPAYSANSRVVVMKRLACTP